MGLKEPARLGSTSTSRSAEQSVSLDHGLASKAIPGSHVEDACFVNGQVAHQGKPVDGAVAVDRHCVDKGGEAETVPQGEGDDTCAGQQRLSRHIDNGNLQQVHMSADNTSSSLLEDLCNNMHSVAYKLSSHCRPGPNSRTTQQSKNPTSWMWTNKRADVIPEHIQTEQKIKARGNEVHMPERTPKTC